MYQLPNLMTAGILINVNTVLNNRMMHNMFLMFMLLSDIYLPTTMDNCLR